MLICFKPIARQMWSKGCFDGVWFDKDISVRIQTFQSAQFINAFMFQWQDKVFSFWLLDKRRWKSRHWPLLSSSWQIFMQAYSVWSGLVISPTFCFQAVFEHLLSNMPYMSGRLPTGCRGFLFLLDVVWIYIYISYTVLRHVDICRQGYY